MVALDEYRIVSASDDKTLRLWDVVGAGCERVMPGHRGAVWAVAMINENRVVSGSWDTTLRARHPLRTDAATLAFTSVVRAAQLGGRRTSGECTTRGKSRSF